MNALFNPMSRKPATLQECTDAIHVLLEHVELLADDLTEAYERIDQLRDMVMPGQDEYGSRMRREIPPVTQGQA